MHIKSSAIVLLSLTIRGIFGIPIDDHEYHRRSLNVREVSGSQPWIMTLYLILFPSQLLRNVLRLQKPLQLQSYPRSHRKRSHVLRPQLQKPLSHLNPPLR
jgi:hypothetical protein